MQVKPLHNYIHIEMVNPSEKIGDLILVKNDRRPRWGIVQAAGEGTYDITGNLIPTLLKKNDLVFFLLHGPEIVQIFRTDEKVAYVSELDCLAKWEELHKLFTPLGDYIQIEYVKPPEEISPGGIILPETMLGECPKQLARIIKLGAGLRAPDGTIFPFQVKEGDIVHVKEHSSLEVKLNDVTGDPTVTYLISQNDILGIDVLRTEQEKLNAESN